MPNKLKPKVGEIWEVHSNYNWGKCLVLVTSIFPFTLGLVIDSEIVYTEKERYCKELRMDWFFLKEHFIRRIQEAE